MIHRSRPWRKRAVFGLPCMEGEASDPHNPEQANRHPHGFPFGSFYCVHLSIVLKVTISGLKTER